MGGRAPESPIRCTRRILCALLFCLAWTLLNAPISLAAPRQAALTADIPAQPLADALEAFARQTGLQFGYVSGVVSSQKSHRVPAGMPAAEALAQLLEGTGLQFEFMTARSVHIFVARPAPTPLAPQRALTATDEVVVTALGDRKSNDRMPIAMSVWTSETLQATGVTDLADVAAHTPGVYFYHISELGAGIRTDLTMRGLSSDIHSSNSGIYVDDVPIHIRDASASSFGPVAPATFDMDRVEVLYGPQGTLGGDAAASGAIRFFTTQPSLTDWSAAVRAVGATTAHGGTDGQFGAAFGGPIVPRVAGVRVSLWTQSDGGYVDRVNPFDGTVVDRNANHLSTGNARAALTLAPTGSVLITPSLSFHEVRLHDSPIFYDYLSEPGAGVLRNGKLVRQPLDDRFYLGSLKAIVEFARTRLTSVTAYTRRAVSGVADTTNEIGANRGGWGNPLGPEYPVSYRNAVPTTLADVQTSLSQEFRLASRDAGSPVTWLAGAWFARSIESESAVTAAVDPGVAHLYDGASRTRATTTQADAFGDIDVRVAARLHAGAGVRVSQTQVQMASFATGPLTQGAPATVVGDLHSTPVTPRFTVTYTPEGYGLLYLSIAEGYRLGGVNLTQHVGCADPYPLTYRPDRVWSYELGGKTRSNDGVAQINAAVFHLAWKDIQQLGVTRTCADVFTTNASTAASDGFDLSATLGAFERVQLGAAVEYADARYTHTVRYSQGFVVHAGDALGLAPYVAPPWSGSAWIDATVWQTARWAAGIRLDGIVNSHNPGPFYTQDPANREYAPSWVSDPAIALVNCRARLSWSSWEISAFVNNVLDSQPMLGHKSDTRTSNLFYASTFRPRTIGLTASLRF